MPHDLEEPYGLVDNEIREERKIRSVHDGIPDELHHQGHHEWHNFARDRSGSGEFTQQSSVLLGTGRQTGAASASERRLGHEDQVILFLAIFKNEYRY